MKDLIAEYKRDTGLDVDPKVTFNDVEASDMNDPTEKKKEALSLVQSDGFLSGVYLVEIDFFDWLMEKANQ